MQLRDLTTLRVGGPADEVLAPADEASLVAATLEVWASGEDWFVLGGGSNVVVSDEGFAGTVIRVVTRGIEALPGNGNAVRLRVQAGEPWDALVQFAVENGLAGLEALSGIPGSSGAAPIQNIGAYGQEIASHLVAVHFLDYVTGELGRVEASALDLHYRSSAIKNGRRGVVVAIELELARTPGGLSEPIGYSQLALALGRSVGDRVPLADVRSAVLALRASKGMLLDDADPDSVSAGSFFTNPIVSERFAGTLPLDAPRWPVSPDSSTPMVRPLDTFDPADVPVIRSAADRRVKLSAAWLIEHSGVTRGFRLPGSRAAVSGKHTLAIVNTGAATATEIAELARFIQSRVLSTFGVILAPEPVFVGAFE
ncbi:UDP-N-acetylmuramate dehydrogenase [Lacisediminihabitans profunda]|uniref:UDP-N-acetylenolpyruvoylglucosamine reductase n=1 Tax=Lacisediminihabitans profunda TaxID=2594790 RepID=A0A5C8UVH7_9MICO|nr:UDP-N-acetylmuramate dehydrogenase [Lacisediminihabitans profunda]TXN32528.1 UDP-N-acetylmuramate dehydrogenase [Lacisediminihabitans profunda]